MAPNGTRVRPVTVCPTIKIRVSVVLLISWPRKVTRRLGEAAARWRRKHILIGRSIFIGQAGQRIVTRRQCAGGEGLHDVRDADACWRRKWWQRQRSTELIRRAWKRRKVIKAPNGTWARPVRITTACHTINIRVTVALLIKIQHYNEIKNYLEKILNKNKYLIITYKILLTNFLL
ncbi:hypothetical protein ACS0TY_023289 [Phlomoides rotata]